MNRARLALALSVALTAGRAVAVEPVPPAPPEVRYKPGSGFTLANSDDFTLQITGRVQARYAFTNFDSDRHKEDTSSFTTERIRFGAKGTVFKVWKFEFEEDFGKSAIGLKKGVLAWAAHDAANVEMGQFNVKFDRQQFTSSGKQMFVDRSLAAGRFGTEYDTGIDVAGSAKERKFQYNVGIFEGESVGTLNANAGHAYVARVSFNPNGDFGYSEGDIKKTDYHLWCLDFAALRNEDQWKDANSDSMAQPGELTTIKTYVAGFGYRHAGVYLQGENYWRNTRKADGTGNVDGRGWYAELGYTIIKDKWELAGRWSEADLNTHQPHDMLSEKMLGVNRYLHGVGHALKIQGDFSWLDEQKAASTTTYGDWRLRMQTQIIF